MSDAAWLTTSSAGSGSGTVNYNVAANLSGAARTATITVQGQAYVVNQSAVGLMTTYSNTTPIQIRDGAPTIPYPSTINVSGFSGTVGTLTVSLPRFSHLFPTYTGFLLVGPGGQSIVLMAGVLTHGVNNVNLTFDDAAPANPSGTPTLVRHVQALQLQH